MGFLAPLWLAAAAVVAAGVVVAHLFSTTVPPQDVLPTVRFIPDGTPMTVLRTRRVTDVWLLMLRLLAVALLGVALAGVHVRKDAPRRVVLVDRSRAVRSFAEVADSARPLSGNAVFVAFDSAAGVVERETFAPITAHAVRGSLSAGVIAAHRALSRTPDGRDRTELVIVSPLVREELDSATARLLALWEGPIRLVRVSAASEIPASGWEIRATGDDPVAAALGFAPRVGAPMVRVVRTEPTSADSSWAHDSGGALVIWPAVNGGRTLAALAPADAQGAGGIVADGHVSIAKFSRELRPRSGRAIVRWIDGSPAATERPWGRGCIREVAIPVDAVGDVALRDSFRHIARSLLEPCGGRRDFAPVDSGSFASLRMTSGAVTPSRAGSVILSRAAAKNLPSGSSNAAGRVPLWLALAALGALVAEQLIRSRVRVA